MNRLRGAVCTYKGFSPFANRVCVQLQRGLGSAMESPAPPTYPVRIHFRPVEIKPYALGSLSAYLLVRGAASRRARSSATRGRCPSTPWLPWRDRMPWGIEPCRLSSPLVPRRQHSCPPQPVPLPRPSLPYHHAYLAQRRAPARLCGRARGIALCLGL